MKTSVVSWDAERQRELDSALACLTRLSDYNIEVEWEWEAEGGNNEYWTDQDAYTETIEGFKINADPWASLSKIRTWWQFLRLDSGISTTEAAAQLDVAPSTISKYELGQRTPMGPYRRRYQHWLELRRSELIGHYRNRVINLLVERDGWPEPPTGVERGALLDEFSRIGGWHDQWRRTGAVPNTRR